MAATAPSPLSNLPRNVAKLHSAHRLKFTSAITHFSFSSTGTFSRHYRITVLPFQFPSCRVTEPYLINSFEVWQIRSSTNGSGFDSPSSDDSSGGGTRLIRAIRALQTRIGMRIQELRKNLPMKLLFFLVGFYCATAFATVIGQTGDWDILSAGLAVVIVEAIGALMYKGSLRLLSNIKSLITMFNYWKFGLSLGLFLDSFKYEVGDLISFDIDSLFPVPFDIFLFFL
ncbi:unnamed protein product [Linum tenue]|uniref:Ycf20-like protein n=1 Tax=Linum tenue TaxID=586396 RepID=A0AAV0RRN0_9ROSI|nr:unnamed protein product [Linum tenue]